MPTVLGILSDSHGRVASTREAVGLLLDRGADLLIHLGGIGGDDVIDELVGHDAHIVFGNCDLDEAELASYARSVDVEVDHPLGRLEIDGRQVYFTHGHLDSAVAQATDERPDYLLHGHTHVVRDERAGPTRIINPGALFRAKRYTAALLEPASDRLEIVEIPRQEC